MKICYFAESYPPVISGTSISLHRLTKQLKKQSIDFKVVTVLYPHSPKDENIIYYSSFALPNRFDLRVGVPSVSKLLPLIRKFSPDVIHAHQPFLLGQVAIKVARRLKIPVFGTIHTQYDHESYLHYLDPLPKFIARRLMRNIMRSFCNKLDGVITPAHGMSRHLLELKTRTPIHVIPNGADLNFLDKADAGTYRFEHSKGKSKSLVFAGRLKKEKNLFFLLDSFVLVLNKHPDVRLVLIGDGPELNNLKAYASHLGVSDNIEFTGWIDPHHVGEYYLSSDIFVMPSISEVDPLCLKEALVAGVPVVAIDSYASGQILENGMDSILTSDHPGNFSDAVNSLLENPDKLKNMSLSAKANSTKFTMEQQVESLIKVYSKLLDKNKMRRETIESS